MFVELYLLEEDASISKTSCQLYTPLRGHGGIPTNLIEGGVASLRTQAAPEHMIVNDRYVGCCGLS